LRSQPRQQYSHDHGHDDENNDELQQRVAILREQRRLCSAQVRSISGFGTVAPHSALATKKIAGLFHTLFDGIEQDFSSFPKKCLEKRLVKRKVEHVQNKVIML
jgi:hypothetical protein